MPADDLAVLSAALRSRVRADENGEVLWHVTEAPSVLEELAQAGRVVLGLDVRTYDENGAFFEIAWSSYEGNDAADARDAALRALGRDELPGDWILITW